MAQGAGDEPDHKARPPKGYRSGGRKLAAIEADPIARGTVFASGQSNDHPRQRAEAAPNGGATACGRPSTREDVDLSLGTQPDRDSGATTRQAGLGESPVIRSSVP